MKPIKIAARNANELYAGRVWNYARSSLKLVSACNYTPNVPFSQLGSQPIVDSVNVHITRHDQFTILRIYIIFLFD